MATEMLQYLDTDGLDETVLNIGQIKTSLEADMQDLPYARPDGIYPDMTVGAVIGADSTAQWAQRESTGSGAATVRSVQGAAVAWRQDVRNGNFVSTDYWTANNASFSVSENTMSMTATAQNGRVTTDTTVNAKNGDKILIKCAVNPTSSASIRFGSYFSSSYNKQFDVVAGWQEIANIFAVVANYTSLTMGVTDIRTEGFDPIQVRNVMAFNLTQMFGRGNEPATVEEFERMYPASYYPYSAPILKPVRIAGMQSTNAQGGELDAIEWTTQTLRAAGSVADVLYSDHVDVNVGVVDLGTLTWTWNTSWQTWYTAYLLDVGFVGSGALTANVRHVEYPATTSNSLLQAGSGVTAGVATIINTARPQEGSRILVRTGNDSVQPSGLLYYQLATPTTQPIEPTLDMTYRVEQGGSESIIVPDGEISAAPVLTVAEPVNAGDEFARIWEAIQSLGYTRNTAQLSRPVSLTDAINIDETQKDTTDVVEIDTTKEVQE